MAYTKTEKRVQFKSDSPRKHSKMGPLLVLMSIFTNPVALAEVFRPVRWPNGVFCPHCIELDNIKNAASRSTTGPKPMDITNVSGWDGG